MPIKSNQIYDWKSWNGQKCPDYDTFSYNWNISITDILYQRFCKPLHIHQNNFVHDTMKHYMIKEDFSSSKLLLDLEVSLIIFFC